MAAWGLASPGCALTQPGECDGKKGGASAAASRSSSTSTVVTQRRLVSVLSTGASSASRSASILPPQAGYLGILDGTMAASKKRTSAKITPEALRHLGTLPAQVQSRFGVPATQETIVSALVLEITVPQLAGILVRIPPGASTYPDGPGRMSSSQASVSP